jgi:hypothetical protein
MAAHTFNALGIFGRLSAEQEVYFLSLQAKYAPLSKTSEAFGVFPHLTVVAGFNVPDSGLEVYTEVLEKLTACIPLVFNIAGVQVIDQNIALSFDIDQTQQARKLAASLPPDQVIATDYFTVVREVPKTSREELLGILSGIRSLTITDFKLCADRVDNAHILQASSQS